MWPLFDPSVLSKLICLPHIHAHRKTYTMGMGAVAVPVGDAQEGVAPRVVRQVFDRLGACLSCVVWQEWDALLDMRTKVKIESRCEGAYYCLTQLCTASNFLSP